MSKISVATTKTTIKPQENILSQILLLKKVFFIYFFCFVLGIKKFILSKYLHKILPRTDVCLVFGEHFLNLGCFEAFKNFGKVFCAQRSFFETAFLQNREKILNFKIIAIQNFNMQKSRHAKILEIGKKLEFPTSNMPKSRKA